MRKCTRLFNTPVHNRLLFFYLNIHTKQCSVCVCQRIAEIKKKRILHNNRNIDDKTSTKIINHKLKAINNYSRGTTLCSFVPSESKLVSIHI